MAIVDEQVERYALEITTPFGDAMAALEAEARERLPLPQMLSGPIVGRLLESLVAAAQARLVLEIGTYAGYSALAMASGLPPGGRVISCEISESHAEFARRHIAASPHADAIDVRVGPALETIAGLEGPFDLVFIDADKVGYDAYYEAVLPKLAAHGLIVLDNTLRDGRVLQGSNSAEEGVRAMAALNDKLSRDDRVTCVLLTVRDGLTLVRRR